MFRTDDINELSVLHKLILEGKFKIAPFSEEILSSPDAAGLSDRIYDELCKARGKLEKGADKEWQEWRRIRFTEGVHKGSYRGYRGYALMNARRDEMFRNASDEDRRALVKVYLSPFTCTEAEIDEFISEALGSGTMLAKVCKPEKMKGMLLLRACCYNGECAQVTLMDLKRGGKKLDIFFEGIKSFALETEGEESDIPPTLESVFVTTDKLTVFEAVFSAGGMKKTLRLKALRTFIN